MKGSADQFIRRFDRDQDGYLSRDELPPRLAQMFERWDRNGDGKLDRQEVEQMMQVVRRRLGIEQQKSGPAAGKPDVDTLVNRWLERMDKDKDGRLSRDEAQNRLAQF